VLVATLKKPINERRKKMDVKTLLMCVGIVFGIIALVYVIVTIAIMQDAKKKCAALRKLKLAVNGAMLHVGTVILEGRDGETDVKAIYSKVRDELNDADTGVFRYYSDELDYMLFRGYILRFIESMNRAMRRLDNDDYVTPELDTDLKYLTDYSMMFFHKYLPND